MKIIFLNTWLGKLEEPLFEFIKKQFSNTDIFCFQEVDPPLYKKLSNLLTDFDGMESHKYLGPHNSYQLSVFVKKKHKILRMETNIIEGKEMGDCLIAQLSNMVVCSVHGMAYPGDKRDTDERIKQSHLILESLKNSQLPKIIGGDFNLFPDTKSIKMFEKAGYRNLIKDFNIESTRNNLAVEQARKRMSEGVAFYGIQPHADYVFISKDIKVNSFEVPNIEVSDHLPLILDFDL